MKRTQRAGCISFSLFFGKQARPRVCFAVAMLLAPLAARHALAPLAPPPLPVALAAAPRAALVMEEAARAPWPVRGGAALAFLAAASPGSRPGAVTVAAAAAMATLAPTAGLVACLLVATGAANYYPINFVAMSAGMAAAVTAVYRGVVAFDRGRRWWRRVRVQAWDTARDGAPPPSEPADDGVGIFAFAFGNLLLWIALALPPPFPS